MNTKLSLLLTMAALAVIIGCKPKSDDELMAKAKKIHSHILSIDTHTDTPFWFHREEFDFSGEDENNRAKVNLKKMSTGALDAVFLAVFIGQDDRTPEMYDTVYKEALDIFNAIHSTAKRHADKAAIALTSKDAYQIKKEGKKALFIGIENGYPIGKDLGKLSEFYNLGARYLTLCHTRNNDICDSSTDPDGAEHNGLSPFGYDVVRELNRLGMLVDVSHISDSSFYQALRTSKVPVLASHSNARSVCDNPRNLTDDMIVKLAERGGVIQVCLLSSYVKPDEPNPVRDSAYHELYKKYNHFKDLSPEVRKEAIEAWYALDEAYPPVLATVSDLVDHIDHIVKIAGIDYVGIGSDFDGGGALDDCRDASQMINITVELLKRGYSESDIEKIWGKNFLRVFEQAERYAQSLK
ncbi:MAG: dipeptidase [Tenuifilaceae bacterium]|jgi:membrane dipeptidase|nr:dipeptidase [Bacteroidales bacterium]MDI9515452.1 dipeptidase [Bacteroidota bacterium]HNV81191.1 dipeptidase [Tenuifilaceae bacterium]HOF92152.1 dipeptidase [Tenuifilaceae bacterium]HOM85197.1 dipeptidase [Tenuifilaceae bacterium]